MDLHPASLPTLVPKNLPRFCCLNPDCQPHQQRNVGNLLVVDRFGKAQHRQIDCRACKNRFSEFQGTPLLDCRPPHEKILAILEHLAEECRTRQTARLVGGNKDTATRIAPLAGQHARATHDELVAFSPSAPGSPA